MSDDFDFEKINGYKRIKIDGKEYKRVSLVGLKTTQQKVKITFDPQNGSKPIVYKIKIGSVFDKLPPEIEADSVFPFDGWYTEPYGGGEQFDLVNSRVWEDINFYPHWEGNYFNIDSNGKITGLNCDRNLLPSNLTIPQGVTAIGDKVFAECEMTSVTIPDSVVTSIGNRAFYNCTGLGDIYYAGNETQWEYIQKGVDWDQYDSGRWSHQINYQLHYNSSGPEAASAEIAEENASSSAAFEEKCAPIVWVKKQRLCA